MGFVKCSHVLKLNNLGPYRGRRYICGDLFARYYENCASFYYAGLEKEKWIRQQQRWHANNTGATSTRRESDEAENLKSTVPVS